MLWHIPLPDGLDLVFVRLFRFSILCVFFWFRLDYSVLVLFAFFVFEFLQYYANKLTGKNVFENVSNGT